MLSEYQKKKIALFFKAMDGNKDGLLKQEDYAQFADKVIALRGMVADSPDAERARGLFMGYWQAIRTMGDMNQVTLDQFLAGHEMMIGNPATYDATIDALTDSLVDILDQDHDGNCTLDEVTSFYLPLDLHDVRKNIASMDVNHDGFISRHEFRELVREFYGNDPNATGSRLLGLVN